MEDHFKYHYDYWKSLAFFSRRFFCDNFPKMHLFFLQPHINSNERNWAIIAFDSLSSLYIYSPVRLFCSIGAGTSPKQQVWPRLGTKSHWCRPATNRSHWNPPNISSWINLLAFCWSAFHLLTDSLHVSLFLNVIIKSKCTSHTGVFRSTEQTGRTPVINLLIEYVMWRC